MAISGNKRNRKSRTSHLGAASVVFLCGSLAFAQSPKTNPSSAWTMPRTADGHPDLQGIWSNATNKPIERPKDLGAKEFYTEKEMAELQAKGYLGERNAPPEAHYDFAQFRSEEHTSELQSH